jgi:hypothetical protein
MKCPECGRNIIIGSDRHGYCECGVECTLVLQEMMPSEGLTDAAILASSYTALGFIDSINLLSEFERYVEEIMPMNLTLIQTVIKAFKVSKLKEEQEMEIHEHH